MKKTLALGMAAAMTATLLAGCGGSSGSAASSAAASTAESTASSTAAASTAESTGSYTDYSAGFPENVTIQIPVYDRGFENWNPTDNYYTRWIQSEFGDKYNVTVKYVAIARSNEVQDFNQMIAAGNAPTIIFHYDMPAAVNYWSKGAEQPIDLDEVAYYAPTYWDNMKDTIETYGKLDGENAFIFAERDPIYYNWVTLIRKDWLDNLGLDMPTTQEEFVEVLRAFKNDDPNGNGVADEIPTGGRAEARWMGQLFGQYGIAMWEGYPQWDIYDGELTYSAVTKNMRDCLEWMSGLYAEGLLDPETFLNDKAAWDGKINSGVVGIWEHLPQECYNYAENIYNGTGVKPEIAVLPAISAPGYEGYYTMHQMNGGGFVVANTDDEAKIDRIMKVLDAYGNQDLWMKFYNGVEGMHSEVVNGESVRLPDDPSTQQNLVLVPFNQIATIDFQVNVLSSQLTDDRAWAVSQAIENVQENQKYVKSFAGDGMPESITSDYPDIANRTLYIEYATKIITGEYSIDKFDEFVEKWYATGGTEVTEKAREWYAKKAQ